MSLALATMTPGQGVSTLELPMNHWPMNQPNKEITMTVAQLVEALQRMPQDYPISHGLAIEPGDKIMGVTQVDYSDKHYVVLS